MQDTASNTHAIDFHLMQKKSYEKTSQFLYDVEWFAYNCAQNSKDPLVASAASELVNYLLEDMRSISICVECYEHAFAVGESSFIIPCEKPHLLVWADAEEYGCWPAKAMKIDQNTVHVRFFGDHTTADLPLENCLVFTKEYPENSTKCSLQTYDVALKVKLDHLIH